MGTTLNAVDHLCSPFRSVDEQVFVIPQTGSNEIDNKVFKINLMLHGSSLHEVDSGSPVRFEAGDIVVLPRPCRHRYRPASPHDSHRLHAVRLILDPDSLPPAGGVRGPGPRPDPEADFGAFVRHHLRDAVHIPHGQDAAVRAILADIRQEAEERRSGYRFRVTALCTSLVVAIARRLSHTAPQGAGRGSGRAHLVLHAQEYLFKNLGRSLLLDEIAGHLHVSPEHLARVFKHETGQTVFGHLQQLRVEKAKTCLIGTDESVTEIADRTGFTSVALFSRTFRRAVGVSPLQYRKKRWQQA